MTSPALSTVIWSRDFVVIDGASPLDRALAEIEHATAAAVIVRQPDGRLYVFRREELAGNRRLRALQKLGLTGGRSIAAVLQLHAAHASQTVRAPVVPDEPRRPAERPPWSGGILLGVDAARCAERLVLVDHEQHPAAVAGPDIGERSAHRAARSAPPPTAAAPPMVDVAPDEDAAPDDDTGAVRHPSITADGAPQAGRPITLTIDLTRARTHATSGDAMAFDSSDPQWQSLEVGVHAVCPAIAFETASGTITVRRNADSLPAVVRGVVDAQERPGDSLDVSVVFMHAGRFSGHAMRRLTIEAIADAPTPPQPSHETAPSPAPAGPSTAPAPDNTGGTTAGALRVEIGAEPPDLTVQIMVPKPSRPGELHWLVMPRELFDELPPSLEGGTNVGRSTESYMTTMFAEYAQLERGQHRRRIEGFGEKLWEKVPACFRETYWAMWDRYQRPLTIQFISAEPNLPWELMRPSRPGVQHDILAVQHPVARWIASYRSYLRNRLPHGGLCTIAPRYASASARLPRAEVEAQRLVDELGATRVEGTYEAVLALLEATALPSDVSLLHFAGHGRFAADTADSSTIKLEDGSLAVSEVAREAVQLGVRCRTVVFFNACEVGATATALGALGGWADAFLGRRFGGFIAPLWAVDDEDAFVVSQELLDGIVRQHRPVGAVLQGIRAKYGDVSPTFFSYLYYGDVTACIGSGAIT